MKTADLPSRILAMVAKATSQHPARAADVLALVGGDEPAFWAAVEQLYSERRINTAHIQKKGDTEPWLAMWPTGACLPVPPMSGNSFAGLFVKHRPDDLYAAHAPRSTPIPAVAPAPAPVPKPLSTQEAVMDAATTTHRAKGSLQNAVTDLIRGRERAAALTVADVADKLNDAADNVRFPLRALLGRGVIAETTHIAGRRKVLAYYDPKTDAAHEPVAQAEGCASAEAMAPDNPRPPMQPAPQPRYRAGDIQVTEIPAAVPAAANTRIEFALWDDGRLVIADGDEIIQIPRDATQRLALLLGVPFAAPVSSLGA